METWKESKLLYQGQIFSLRVGEVQTHNGEYSRREIIDHSGGVAIVPVINNKILLVKQFRISIEREIIELPAGRLESGDSPQDRAQIELEEELGYRAHRLIPLLTYYSSVGFTNEKMHIFLALNLEQTQARPEWDEHIETVKIPLKEVEAMLANNAFEDAKTIIGLERTIGLTRRQPDLFSQ